MPQSEQDVIIDVRPAGIAQVSNHRTITEPSEIQHLSPCTTIVLRILEGLPMRCVTAF